MEVSFLNSQEVRMGSPHNICDLEITGEWIPELPKEDWQDITASSPDNRFVGLVAWDVSEDNQPGFKIYCVDTLERSFTVSDRINGCCWGIEWSPIEEYFSWRVS